MTLDHGGTIFFTDGSAFYLFFKLIGRVALPIFAFLAAWHFQYNTKNRLKYMGRLLVAAAIAQYPFHWFHQAIGRETSLNILFTLLLGLAIIYVYTNLLSRIKAKSDKRFYTFLMTMVLTAVVIQLSLFVEYGLMGVMLPVSFWLIARYRHWTAIVLMLAVMALLSNVSIYTPTTLMTLLVIWIVDKQSITLPRANKYLFYAWYPLHLLVYTGISKLL